VCDTTVCDEVWEGYLYCAQCCYRYDEEGGTKPCVRPYLHSWRGWWFGRCKNVGCIAFYPDGQVRLARVLGPNQHVVGPDRSKEAIAV
jgi:hypothetical protein